MALTGPADRQLSTGADGKFSSLLPVGDYQVVITAFGYAQKTATATITPNGTTTLNVALDAVPSVNISGTVTDGSGHGWPLYAKVTVVGPSGLSDYTTPSNGRYSLTVPAGATYSLNIESVYPGYETVTKEVVVASRNVVTNVAVPANADACETAPGYEYGSDGEFQTFSGGTTPDGWEVVDHLGNGQVWKFTDDSNRGNLTGGGGGFANVDSDRYGSSGQQDTSLVSPVVDLSDVSAPVIRFNQDFNWLGPETADVDLSLDGGQTWANVLSQKNDAAGPRVTEVAIPQAAGQSQVRVRFHYYDAAWEWWWQVDNVLIGSEVNCVPTDGAMVFGHVRDKNTGGYVNGATVTSVDKPAEKVTTVATPDDTGLEDGFYWMFSSLTGTHKFTATAGNYVSQSKNVDVQADWATGTNFQLKAGQLSVTPGTLTGNAKIPSGKASKTFTVTNTGGAPVDVAFGERDAGFELERADGSRVSRQQILGAEG
ncbi:carboxypeptidase regulatory-like domain-containing protein, partial [Micromonospora azadirachtae]